MISVFLNFNGAIIRTYTLGGPFNTTATISMGNGTLGQSFNTAGNEFSFTQLTVKGTGVKTINFGNSRISSSTLGATHSLLSFQSPNTTTTYTTTSSKLIFSGLHASRLCQIVSGDGVAISVDSIITNTNLVPNNQFRIDLAMGTIGTPTQLNTNISRN